MVNQLKVRQIGFCWAWFCSEAQRLSRKPLSRHQRDVSEHGVTFRKDPKVQGSGSQGQLPKIADFQGCGEIARPA